MRNVILTVVGSLVALVVVVFAIGAFLPLEHQVTRSTTVAAPPESVWTVITDFAHQPAWRPSLRQVDRVTTDSTRDVWREVESNGNTMSFATTAAEPPARLVRTVADRGGPFSGSWEIRIMPTEGGSLVQVTERGAIPNPLFRFADRFIIGEESGIQRYLDDLTARFGGSTAR